MSTVTTLLGLTKPIGTEQFSRATYNNNLDLIDTYCINQVEKRAKGLVSSKPRASASAGITGKSIVENIASFAFKGGRKYRISWSASCTVSVTDGYFTLGISTCSTADASSLTTGLTDLVTRSTKAVGTGGEPVWVTVIYAPVSDTTLQVKFWAERATGTGTWTMEAKVADFTIEDEGAQF